MAAAAQFARLSSPETGDGAVMAPVREIVRGIAARDPAILAAQLRDGADITVVAELPGGARDIRHMTAAEFSGSVRAGAGRLQARLGRPSIRVDGDLAMAWTPYVFLRDGRADHCGVNHFDLVREAGAWKIQNVTWTLRKSGCPGA
jgi:hypothetical protein